MKVTLHPAAEKDVVEAAEFYEREGSVWMEFIRVSKAIFFLNAPTLRLFAWLRPSLLSVPIVGGDGLTHHHRADHVEKRLDARFAIAQFAVAFIELVQAPRNRGHTHVHHDNLAY